jgi:hypothetical protein
MKTPRVTDFDPDAKVPTLKSSLDHMPTIQKFNTTHHSTSQRTAQITLSPSRQTPKSVTARSAPQSTKRSFVRRTFDFYDDQITYLTRQSLQERLAGREMSMNEMVREALDDWIKKHTSGK